MSLKDKQAIAHLTSPEAAAADAAARLRDAQQEKVARRAAAEPFPSVTKRVWLEPEGVPFKVGAKEWEVRAVRDRDVQLFERVKSPLADMLKEGVAQEAIAKGIELSGLQAWIVYWIMTRPCKNAREVIMAAGGVETVTALAEEEFGELQRGPLNALGLIVLDQIVKYWSTMAEVVVDEEVTEKETTVVVSNPPSGPATV